MSVLRISADISPCIIKDPESGIGIPLVPGETLNTDKWGISDLRGFLKQNGWAFEADTVEAATASPGQKRSTKRAS